MEPLHVLLVHDDLLVHHIAADALRDGGVELIVAENHAEGLEALRRWPVDVLITELSRLSAGGAFLRRAFALRPMLGWIRIIDPYPTAVPPGVEPFAHLDRPLHCIEIASAALKLAVGRTRRIAA